MGLIHGLTKSVGMMLGMSGRLKRMCPRTELFNSLDSRDRSTFKEVFDMAGLYAPNGGQCKSKIAMEA